MIDAMYRFFSIILTFSFILLVFSCNFIESLSSEPRDINEGNTRIRKVSIVNDTARNLSTPSNVGESCKLSYECRHDLQCDAGKCRRRPCTTTVELSDGSRQIYRDIFDDKGRIQREVIVKDGRKETVQYFYRSGMIEKEIDGKIIERKIVELDPFRRPVFEHKISFPSNADKRTKKIEYKYDSAGHLISRLVFKDNFEHPEVEEKWKYDSKEKLVADSKVILNSPSLSKFRVHEKKGNIKVSIERNGEGDIGKIIHEHYNSNGTRLKKEIDFSGNGTIDQRTEYRYDKSGNVEAIDVFHRYGASSQMKKGQRTLIVYDREGNPISRTENDPNLKTTVSYEYVYDCWYSE